MSETSSEFRFRKVFRRERRLTRRFVIAQKAGLSRINQPSPFRLPRLLYVVKQGVCNRRANYHPAQDQTSASQVVVLQRVMIDVRAGFGLIGESPNSFPQSLARQINATSVHEFQLVVSQRNAKFVRMCDRLEEKCVSGGRRGVPFLDERSKAGSSMNQPCSWCALPRSASAIAVWESTSATPCSSSG